jgi:2'-5' RNA ligase
MTRTFIALDLSRELQRFLAQAIARGERLLPAARWVTPASIHLTLAFLGELSPQQLTRAIEAAEAAARQSAPFGYRLGAPGTFGPARAPRVVWMGIEEPSGELQALQQTLNRELAARGFSVDTRPFTPHLTLARIKVPLSLPEQQSLQRFLQESRVPPDLPGHRVTSLDVMKSELSPTGASYSYLHRARLAAPADGTAAR